MRDSFLPLNTNISHSYRWLQPPVFAAATATVLRLLLPNIDGALNINKLLADYSWNLQHGKKI